MIQVIENLFKSIYGLFRQRDFYILAQASNLSHSVFRGKPVTHYF